MNTLIFNGAFTKNDIHLWIQNLFPDVPVNNEDSVNLFFNSVLTNSFVSCDYKDGNAIIKS